MKFCNGMPSKGSIGVNRKVMVFLDTELSAAIDIPFFKLRTGITPTW